MLLSQKLILLSDNMFDYIVRLLVWAVEGENKVSLHPVHVGSYLYIVHITRKLQVSFPSVHLLGDADTRFSLEASLPGFLDVDLSGCQGQAQHNRQHGKLE